MALTEIGGNYTYGKEVYAVLAAATPKPTMADTERGLENRTFPNPRFCSNKPTVSRLTPYKVRASVRRSPR